MSVSEHLGIAIEEYDQRIRTFIPYYDEILDAAAGAVSTRARAIVDLGVGTGALSARCLTRTPRAKVVGLDADAQILTLARRRLGRNAALACEDFLRAPLPPADAIVASFALHHIRTRTAKRRFYRQVGSALRPGGVFVTADCHPAANRKLAAVQRLAWQSHLRRSYPTRQAAALLRSWAREDVYVPLDIEIELLRGSGFSVEVIWRRDAFAVLMSMRPGHR